MMNAFSLLVLACGGTEDSRTRSLQENFATQTTMTEAPFLQGGFYSHGRVFTDHWTSCRVFWLMV
jgi:hypothetical protein